MKIIAESSSTRTEWALVDGERIVEHAFTTGINPFFQSRREISHCIRLELGEAFFRRRWDHVYFYGAGCSSQEKRKIIESSLVAQFKTPVTVESDLLGAARGLLVRSPGIVCILGTGSNSCLYNGEEIVKTVPPLGYILGDEGSGAYMGKLLIADVIRGLNSAVLDILLVEDHIDYSSDATLPLPVAEAAPPYWQLRAPQFGFLPGLSILDLIFSLGPESALYIRRFRQP